MEGCTSHPHSSSFTLVTCSFCCCESLFFNETIVYLKKHKTIMCILVTRAPTSHLTTPALEELDNLISLFDSASSSSCRPASDLLVRITSASSLSCLIYTLQSSVQTLCRQAHEVIGPPQTHYYHHNDDNTFSPAELDRLNGKTYLFADDHSLLSSSPTNLPIPRSRATSVTISDSAETHLSTFHTTDDLHPTLAQDLEEFEIRSSAPSVSPLSFYDLNDPASSGSDHSPPPAPPPPVPQVVRQTPLEAPKLFLQPIHSRIDPQMHFFHQPYHEPVIEQRRTLPYGSGFGGGFHGGTFMAMPSIGLDPIWHGFAEQLGF